MIPEAYEMAWRTALLLSALVLEIKAEKIRGVPPSKLALYSSGSSTFSCLDGSLKIPSDRVNDDYCDCPDGSDEPGTSACHNGTFFCQNAGHIPAYIPSSRINDGVCEEACCDGSDEWLGLVQCPNTCKQLAKVHAKLEKERVAVESAGWKVKEQWIKEAHQIRVDLEHEINRIQVKQEASQANLVDMEAALARLQEEESQSSAAEQEAARKLAEEFEQSVDRIVSQLSDQEQRIKDLETILSDLAQGYNPNFQDMAVKGAVSAYNELPAIVAREIDISSVKSAFETVSQKSMASANSEAPSISYISKLLRYIKEQMAEYGLIQAIPEVSESSAQSQQLTNMRETVEKAREEVLSTDRDISSKKQSLTENFGEHDVYRAVKGKCFSSVISDYTYEVCLLVNLQQKSASTNTLVGNFDHVDENGSLIYNHGQRCWNGPERSGRVDVECGIENELLSVREAQKCEYVFRIRSPLACKLPKESTIKAEL